jgi:hypothetical protein
MLLRHYVFNMEYVWRVVDRRGDAQSILIEDVKGVTFADVTGRGNRFAVTVVRM